MTDTSYGVKFGKKLQDKKDLETAKKLKPALRRFVVNEQVRKAKETAEKQATEKEKMLLREDVIKRCYQLAMMTFVEKRFYEILPLPFYMDWVTGKDGSGRTLTDVEKTTSFNADVAGFAKCLSDEYNHMEKDIKALKYPNPLQEENLPFFWNKFVMDLRLIILADAKRVEMGNKGAIVSKAGPTRPDGIILPNHKN